MDDNDKKLYECNRKTIGITIVYPVERYKNTSRERLEIVCFYQSRSGQFIHNCRGVSIESLIERIKLVWRIDPLSDYAFHGVSTIVVFRFYYIIY
jgi:hypothetical protein